MLTAWFDAAPDRRRYPKLQGPASADVVVIGGGIVGATAAWRAASRGASVILLEQNHVAGGDTAYTMAMMNRTPDTSLARLRRRYGDMFFRRLFEATTAAQRELFALIADEGIDCDSARCSSYCFSYAKSDPVLRAEWDTLKDTDPRARFLTDAREETGLAAAAEAIVYDDEGHFHARKFVLGLLERLVAGGRVRVFEESCAIGFANGTDCVSIKTAGGDASGKYAILATSMPPVAFPHVRNLFRIHVSYVMASEAEVPFFADANFWNTEKPYNYFRRLNGRRFAIGGVDRDAQSTIPTEDAQKQLLDLAKNRLGGRVKNAQAWSGNILSTDDELPYADALPGHDGRAFIAAGFGGNGMVMGFLAGSILGDRATGHIHPHADLLSFRRNGADRLLKKPEIKKARSAWKWLLPLFYAAVLILPGWVFFRSRGGWGAFSGLDGASFRLLSYPLLGLYAFTMVWAQVVVGANLRWLRKLFPKIDRVHRVQGAAALLLALLHPIFLMTGVGLSSFLKLDYVDPSLRPFILIGDLQLLLMIATVVSALLMKRPFFRRRWRILHYLNYAVFALIWIHSWFLGSDVRGTELRWLWLFFAASVAVSLGLRFRLGRKRAPSNPPKDAKWIAVAKDGDLREDAPLCVKAEGRELALFRVNGAVHALENACTHAGGPLCGGRLKGAEIECPWHSSRFDVRTGAVKEGPAIQPQPRFETRVEKGMIEVKM